MLLVRQKQTASMLTRDGVRLDADVYYPDAEGEFPVLLMRQPYGRAIASTVVYAHPTWYAAHGYIVVIQDVRGRGTSEGVFDLFAYEVEDGGDTVNWAATLPSSTGQVGMYGFSYQGMTQLYAAGSCPPALKTICPAMIGYDLYADWAYEGGAFCLQTNLGWAIQLAAETARLKGDEEAYLTLYGAARNPPLPDPVDVRSGLLKQLAPDSYYHAWLDHPQRDDYWENLSPGRYLDNVDMPMLHIGGWFDTYMRGTLRFYREMVARSQFPQHLWVGPWAHLPWGRKVGAVDYGTEAANPIDRLQIRWFDQFLKGIDTGLLNEKPVHLFELGSNQWRSLPKFPTAKQQPYFLHSTGLASMSDQEGSLEKTPPTSDAQDVFVHDPWRPVPSVGGHAAFPAGSFDRSAVDCRTDVVTYTTKPLDEDLYLMGEAITQLYCTADAPSFDLCAVLSEVHPNGSAFNLAQGYLRIDSSPDDATPNFTGPFQIILQPICAQIAKGNALRLSFSAACFPAYAVNPGTGTSPGNSQLIDAQIITLSIYSGSSHPSQVLLPVTGAPLAATLNSVLV
ncbi:CocE/NonD family hydrolase [Leptolyngbya sp. FACHB-541]|uniref:CocE/NonD family hydrolase n=1 Tax=Leptolyngbya sp. FACHB-541 TaxID=2692810 RepID=UPI0016886771|nr:CocE/NonD family hydrolase [Leptolyngbya sp. FACHB-541]MBD1996966.1 CocE/NonD family hydrolase [Leptolyngbya sp. FACHB-541]